jgi:hypothetical protein
MGLVPKDAGTFVERVIAKVVIGTAVEAHNADVERANREAKKK